MTVSRSKGLVPVSGKEIHSSDFNNSPSVGLCLFSRFCSRALSSITRSAFGCPTRSRALALTAFTAEKVFFLAFFLGMSGLPRTNVALPLGRIRSYNKFVTVAGGRNGRTRLLRREIRAKNTHTYLSALR